jgi:hypothetical protein
MITKDIIKMLEVSIPHKEHSNLVNGLSKYDASLLSMVVQFQVPHLTF